MISPEQESNHHPVGDLDPYLSLIILQLLDVEHSPNMKQYVGLLELICSSSPIPTAEVLQDVSVLFATLGEDVGVMLTFSLTVFISHLPAASVVSFQFHPHSDNLK